MKNGTFLNLMKSGILLVLAPCKFTHSLLRTTCLLWFISFFFTFEFSILDTRSPILDSRCSILDVLRSMFYAIYYVLMLYTCYLIFDAQWLILNAWFSIFYALNALMLYTLYFILNAKKQKGGGWGTQKNEKKNKT